MFRVSVPGKAMLSGEYAVLHGGTAFMVPVPRYLEMAESDSIDAERLTPVLRYGLEYYIEEIADFEKENPLVGFDIDASGFFETDREKRSVKLGVGASAAEAVGLTALRYERAGKSWSVSDPYGSEHTRRIADHAMAIHYKAQGGRGSGADVAACAYRKPIKFRRLSDKRVSIIPLLIRPDAGVKKALLYTGIPADTRKMVDKFESWLENRSSEKDRLLSELKQSSDRLADSWFVRSKEVLFDMIDRFSDAMKQVADASGLEYRLPIHEEIERWARLNGGRAKPTGAGGGDMILLIGELPLHELKGLIIHI
jgi:phosphomevalonate kinase